MAKLELVLGFGCVVGSSEHTPIVARLSQWPQLGLRTHRHQEMGVYVLDNISMVGLAIDKRSLEP